MKNVVISEEEMRFYRACIAEGASHKQAIELVCVGCSETKEEYEQKLPIFRDLFVKVIEGGDA
jgi:hypothetical protein